MNILLLYIIRWIVFRPQRKEPILHFVNVSFTIRKGYLCLYWLIISNVNGNVPLLSFLIPYNYDIISVE